MEYYIIKSQSELNPLLIESTISTRETNENIKTSNKTLIKIFAITAVVSGVAALGSIGQLFKPDDKSDLLHIIRVQDSLIHILQAEKIKLEKLSVLQSTIKDTSKNHSVLKK